MPLDQLMQIDDSRLEHWYEGQVVCDRVNKGDNNRNVNIYYNTLI